MYLLRYNTRPVVHLDGACEVEIGYPDVEEAVDSAIAALEADPSIFVAIVDEDGGVLCTASELRYFSSWRRDGSAAPR